MSLYMSPLHILVTVLIGVLIGCVADILTLQKAPGGVKGFMLVGVIGAFVANLLFRFLAAVHILPALMYIRPTIVLEDIIGAILGVYIFNSIKWEI